MRRETLADLAGSVQTACTKPPLSGRVDKLLQRCAVRWRNCATAPYANAEVRPVLKHQGRRGYALAKSGRDAPGGVWISFS
jgi:hypothetical protein